MRHNKIDEYAAKETLGYLEGKSYISAARGAAKREENQRGIKREAKTQTKNQCSQRRRREKVDKGSIRKLRTQERGPQTKTWWGKICS